MHVIADTGLTERSIASTSQAETPPQSITEEIPDPLCGSLLRATSVASRMTQSVHALPPYPLTFTEVEEDVSSDDEDFESLLHSRRRFDGIRNRVESVFLLLHSFLLIFVPGTRVVQDHLDNFVYRIKRIQSTFLTKFHHIFNRLKHFWNNILFLRRMTTAWQTYNDWPREIFSVVKHLWHFVIKTRLTTLIITTRAFLQNRLSLIEYSLILIDQTQLARGKITGLAGLILYIVSIFLHATFKNTITKRILHFAAKGKYRAMVPQLNRLSQTHVTANAETLLENILTNTQRSQLLETLTQTMRTRFGTSIDFAQFSTPIAFCIVAFIVLMSAILGTAFTPASVDAFVIRQGLVLRSATTLYDTAMNIGFPVAEFVSNVFGIGPILPRDTSQIVAYQSLSALVVKIDNYINRFNENAQVFLAEKGGAEAFRIELNKMSESASKAAIAAKNTSAYNSYLSKLSTLIQHLSAFQTGGSIRQEPVVIYLYGKPNTGKSHMVTPIVELLSCLHNRPLTTWSLGSTSRHFDGYTQQDVVVLDDPFVSVYADENVSRVIQLVSSSPYQVPMAELNEKGMTFTSKYIIITTNSPGAAPTYSDSCAFNRRRHIFVEFPQRQEGQILEGDRMQERFCWMNVAQKCKQGSVVPMTLMSAIGQPKSSMYEIVCAAFDTQNEFAQILASKLDRSMGLVERIQGFNRDNALIDHLPPIPSVVDDDSVGRDTESLTSGSSEEILSADEESRVSTGRSTLYFPNPSRTNIFKTNVDTYEFQINGIRYIVSDEPGALEAIKASTLVFEEPNPDIYAAHLPLRQAIRILEVMYFEDIGNPASFDNLPDSTLYMNRNYFIGAPHFESTQIARAKLLNRGDFCTFTIPGGLSMVLCQNQVRRVIPIIAPRIIPLNDIHFYAHPGLQHIHSVRAFNPFFLPFRGPQREFICDNSIITPHAERIGLLFGMLRSLKAAILHGDTLLIFLFVFACFVFSISLGTIIGTIIKKSLSTIAPEALTFFNGYGFTSTSTGKAQTRKGAAYIELGDGKRIELDEDDQAQLTYIEALLERKKRTKAHVNDPRTTITSGGDTGITPIAPVKETQPSSQSPSLPPPYVSALNKCVAAERKQRRPKEKSVSFTSGYDLLPSSDGDTVRTGFQIHEANSEAARDEQALNLARLCYEKNTFDLVGYHSTATVRNRCLMLRDRIGVSVKHCFNGAQRVEIVRNGENYPTRVLFSSPTLDLTYFEVTDLNFSAVRDITQHMRRRGEFEVLDQVPVLSIFRRDDLAKNGKDYALASVGVARPNVLATVHCSSFVSDGIAITNRTLVDYEVDSQVSQAGDCGYPYVIMHTSVPKKLLGIHFASSGVIGYMVPIYRDDLDKIAVNEGEVKDYPLHLSEAPQFLKDAYPQFDVQYEMCDRQGFIEKTYSPVKTRIHKSPLATPLIPCEHAPAPMTAKDTRVTADLTSIIVNGIKKWTAPRETKIDTSLLAEVIREMKFECYNLLRRGNVFRVLTFDEAVTGTKDIPFSSSLNMATSGGYRFNKKGQGKHAYFEWDSAGRYKLRDNNEGRQLKAYVATAISFLKQSVVYPFVYLATIKDEVIKSRKVPSGESRIFAAAPLDSVLIQRRYFGAAYWAFMASRHTTPVKVGINPHSPEWKQLYQWMTRKSNIGFCCDYKNFDGSLPVEMLEGVCDIYCYLYERLDPNWKECDTTLRKTFYKSVAGPLLGFSSVVLKAPRGNPSGQVGTSIDNCLVNWMAFKYCYKRMQREAQYVGSFNDDVTLAVYGDDNIFTLSPKIVKHFTFPKIKMYMAELGLEITPAAKDKDTADLETVDKMTFLKRHFIVEGATVLARLEEASLGKILHWCKGKPHEFWKTPSSTSFDPQSLEGAILSLQMELTLFPEDLRDAVMSHVDSIADTLNLNIPSFNYFEVKNNIAFGTLIYSENESTPLISWRRKVVTSGRSSVL